MSTLKVAKVVALIYQAVLAIPFVGGSIVLSTGWGALGLGFVIHAIVFILALKSNGAKVASIIGMVTNALAWIPLFGWFMHLVTAVAYGLELLTRKE
ncbi:hypothetical protein CQS04_08220 [Chryseomicrobium excrementi]|uniref:Uncharacterized protein n=1 Tax=Chryseomicrobium excrementi TaxID=2041346 RepID=A0A2M9F0Y6_9BACL|nr:hypothetical protein [Chryseomicrobium excrementi]PJK17124.1 hypothetical protein CQS04_08220 [Chryseomicrobium excrementi]